MRAVEFRSRIRQAIADPQLQAALDANALRRASGRAAALASLPDWELRRGRAHEVRSRVVEHLPEMLRRFEENASDHGIRVHKAFDAAEALSLFMEIAEGPGARRGAVRCLLIAKSKSMVSEEIELNRELARRGHRVVETDLGEYIVQLRGEKPAHIITPAVHLLRGQVGELFSNQLGIPYTEDIPTLTAAARGVLREVFLTADVGVSGVNFGVVETGGLCIVTNEGNGRMVTTMPHVHIALMGIERLVPTLEDLALMLSLLPRSATGQKLSVYTQLIHSPRRNGERDGAQERHVILVDNGRMKMWDSSLREALHCIRCGACLNACPVFREIGGHAYVGVHGEAAPYPGPIGSVISPGLGGLAEYGQLAQASSLCGACKDACPVQIDLPGMLTRVRAGAPETASQQEAVALSSGTRLALRAFTGIAASPRIFRMMQGLAAVGARLLSPRTHWMRLPAFTGWGLSKDLPRPAIKPFRDRWVPEPGLPRESMDSDESRETELPSAPDGAKPALGLDRKSERLTERFAAELEALGAEVIFATRDSLDLEVANLLQKRSIDRALAWDEIEGLDLPALNRDGIEIVHELDPDVRAGITGCLCAISETGTLVLSGSVKQGLSVSLLPDVHVAIVQEQQILRSLEEALSQPEVRSASATVLISGPSRTADIEMTLTIGVHGPKELVVCIIAQPGRPN